MHCNALQPVTLTPSTVLRSTLIITEWPTTQLAFNELGVNVASLTPWRISRGDGTNCLATVQAGRHQLLVIDVPPLRHWKDNARSTFWNQARTWINECFKTSTRVLLIGPRSSEWNESPVTTVIHEHGLHRAEHRWCAFNLSVSSELKPHERSNHAYMTATSWKQPSHDCHCEAGVTHVQDRLGREFSRSRKSNAYQVFSVKLLTTLLESGSLRLPDFQEDFPDRGRGTEVNDVFQSNPHTSDVRYAHQHDQGHSRQDSQIQVQSTKDQEHTTHSFPTDQRERQKRKTDEAKQRGETLAVNKKRKHVEEHFDDCGDSLDGLHVEVTLLNGNATDDDSTTSDEDSISDQWPMCFLLGSEVQNFPRPQLQVFIASTME